MKIIRNPFTDPYFNLASEEYLIDSSEDDIFMLWRNEPSVIIGKNQNAYAELNIDFVLENKIKVVRRLTGGGAVFHDLGNVNFTFITREENCNALDFKRFTAPVIKALCEMGAPAKLSGRNDIIVEDRKISGNAQCVRNGKLMHHGTLLFSADMSKLAGALRPDDEKLKSKGIKSVRSRVGNLTELYGITAEAFIAHLEENMGKDAVPFSENDEKAIRKLANEKYSTWDWNFGKSGKWEAEKKKRFPFGTVSVSFSSDKGRIKDIKIEGDFFGIRPVTEIEEILVGLPLERNALTDALHDVSSRIAGAEATDIAELILF